jgi:asparagine synthase (glutamine-hydrolysing)
MHLSEPHLLAPQMAKPAVKCYFLVKVPMRLMGGYTRYKALQHPSLLHVITLLGNFRFV